MVPRLELLVFYFIVLEHMITCIAILFRPAFATSQIC